MFREMVELPVLITFKFQILNFSLFFHFSHFMVIIFIACTEILFFICFAQETTLKSRIKLRKFCPTGLTANSFWKFGHSTISMYLFHIFEICLEIIVNNYPNDEGGSKKVKEKCRRLLWPVPNRFSCRRRDTWMHAYWNC